MATILRLGSTPLANDLLTRPEDANSQPRYPLDLVFCPSCSLVQVERSVDREVLFGNYPYFSSYSDTMLGHVQSLAERLVSARGLGPTSFVVELASNDGYLLRNYIEAGVPVLGIEPAANVAATAVAAGVPTLRAFFDASLGARLATEGRRADVVHAHNVLAHVPDPAGFVRGIGHLLQPKGVAVIEVPYLGDMLDRCEFDTIYHEHLCYFSLTALNRLFSDNGLVIRDVERVAIHGGSLRLFADRRGGNVQGRSVTELLNEEARFGVGSVDSYMAFRMRVEAVRDELRALLFDLKRQGHTVAAYGASAKGSTLLNYADIGPDTIDFVADRSPHKQGKYMPGRGIPIYSADHLLERQPDYCLLLAWNFEAEILQQQSEYLRRGGRFIRPVPQPTLIGRSRGAEGLA